MTADRIVYVTGVSCAGKTTLGQLLARRGNVIPADVDREAVVRPSAGHIEWLKWRNIEYLHRATTSFDGQVVVVTGICLPHWLIESAFWRPAMKVPKLEVDIIMLNPSWSIIKDRLAERAEGEELRKLRKYNKSLRRKMEDQVLAYRRGEVIVSNTPTPGLISDIEKGMF